jgi:RNase H-fold protein (predicted Holliday junction resolvase)
MNDAIAPKTQTGEEYLLGFDPGRDKCGVAVVDIQHTPHYHTVVPSERAIATLQSLLQDFPIQRIILGDQTTSSIWKRRIEQELSITVPISLVDERYTTLEARDRYWTLYPPRGIQRLIPKEFRQISRPIDDIVAILLVERYLAIDSAV